MKDIPNCKVCKLKCCGCTNYSTCVIRKEENGYKVEDCTLIASEHYLFNEYLDNPNMLLCRYQDVCKSLFEAWND